MLEKEPSRTRVWYKIRLSPARYAVFALCIGALWLAGAGQKIQFVPRDKAEILERFQEMPASDRDRASTIRSMFLAEGCKGSLLQDQFVEGADAPNIVCLLRGDSEETVIVGAHYDRSASGGRRMDNWSGAALLPSIYHSLHARQRHHSFIFVAFADKQDELTGAKWFAGRMSAAQLQNTEAMINLDVLGLSPTKVWSSHSDKELVQDLVAMEYALKLPASQMDLQEEGETDSEAFASQRVPRITIHSLTQQNRADGAASTAFRPNNYYDTYRLICGYLAYLDTILKSRPNQG
jgi:Iap family predicted aminopeptidase